MQSTCTYVLIMAGGVGSRFWPASRESRPKQFLDIMGTGRTLLQMTFDRFTRLVPTGHIYIVTNIKYKRQILEQLPELREDQVIGEPSRNNTAPCVAYASMKLYKMDPEATCFVTPADHVIIKEMAFIELAKKAIGYTQNNDALLTLGITPTRPDTGYGYIEYLKEIEENGIFKVRQFKEKPILEVAKEYLGAGNFLWNSGMFIWSLKSVMHAFENHAPGIFQILHAGMPFYNTVKEQEFVTEQYPKTEKTSVDYAIMERASNVFTIPADIGWTDLGTWASLHNYLEKDENGNVIQSKQGILLQCENSIIRTSPGQLIVAKGLENYIVIQDEDCLLIYPMQDEQEVKQITTKIQSKGWDKHL